MKRAVYLFLFITISFAYSAQGQVIEDALRFSHSGTLVSTRSAGMGNAFVGLANDASALYWNPAGLGQLRTKEFSLGLAHVGMDNDATMFDVTTAGTNSGTVLSNLNLAIPFPVVRGSFVVAAGYNRLHDYNGAMEVDVYNPQSSIQASLYNGDAEDLDFAWNLGLEDTLVLNYLDQGQPGWLAIPVANRVQQTIDAAEEGGLNQWSFGGSTEIARGAMVGVALNVLSGSYRYERTFVEADVNAVWQDVIVGVPLNGNDFVSRTDFQRLTLSEEINQDISGWNMKFGFLYNIKDEIRVGFSVQTSTLITINEDYFKSGDSEFADANLGYDLTLENHNYDISTPAIYSVGASYSPTDFATVSADFEMVNYSDIEFDGSNELDELTLTQFNRDIRRTFRNTNNFRIGAEFNIPKTGLFLRGGFGYRYSPYDADEGKSEYDVKTLSAGVGYKFRNNLAVQAAYVMSNYETFSFNYIDPDDSVPESAFTSSQEISVSQMMFGLAYYF